MARLKGLRFLSLTVDSHQHGVEYAECESKRTGQDCWLVEYRENDSTDDMRFFEVVQSERLGMLIEHYDVVSTLRFTNEK